MKTAIKRLRLKRGDTVVVKDGTTMRRISQVPMPELDFRVPILCAPEGLKRVPLNILLKAVLVVMKDQNIKVVREGDLYVNIWPVEGGKNEKS